MRSGVPDSRSATFTWSARRNKAGLYQGKQFAEPVYHMVCAGRFQGQAAGVAVGDSAGPGGSAGGRIVAQGTPEQIAKDPASVTGPFLREVL